MFGIRQPLYRPIFEKRDDAEKWSFDVMVDHYDRQLGMSDAKIEPFKGMVDYGPPPDPARLRDIERISQQVKESAREKTLQHQMTAFWERKGELTNAQ